MFTNNYYVIERCVHYTSNEKVCQHKYVNNPSRLCYLQISFNRFYVLVKTNIPSCPIQ